ncbi:MAG: macrolide-specific efflux system membrane fusion protein [Psychromonas sp.]|jgi:macrolide-specific efflux system membrane fusion protein|uniref:efflux RND transporter periplasmic adaptor subunit n=1 Tax=Psychromonas sp. TaxID=1884585 RepID=UPI0039E717FF
MKKKLKSRLIIGLLIVVVAASLAVYLFAGQKDQLVYTTTFVQRGDIENVVLTNGVLYPSKLVNVGAQVSGMIDTISVNNGDEIKQGDLIVQIDSLTQQNALKEAQASQDSIDAQYRGKQAQIRGAASEFKRQKKMLADGSTSQSTYDSAESTLAVYQADLDQLKALQEQALISVDDAKLNLGYTTIAAPIAGTVVYISVEEGQTVNTNQSTPSIIELAQLDVMTVKAQVSEADVAYISSGQSVYFTTLGDTSLKYKGVLRAIEPGPTLMDGDDTDLTIGDSDAIYYNALFDVENPDKRLRFGMTAQVSIILADATDALLVPSQVLVKKANQENAYQVPLKIDGKVEYRDVEVGINNKVYVQILSGLEEGDEVILSESSSADQTVSSRSVQQAMRF